MAIALSLDRTARELTYDQSLVEGDTIDVRAENAEDGDVSTRTGLANDGRFVYTWPDDFSGTTHFTVTGSEGGEDTGSISV